MTTESGFSKAWKGFVDHKWSKKRFGRASDAFYRSKGIYREFSTPAIIPNCKTSPLESDGNFTVNLVCPLFEWMARRAASTARLNSSHSVAVTDAHSLWRDIPSLFILE